MGTDNENGLLSDMGIDDENGSLSDMSGQNFEVASLTDAETFAQESGQQGCCDDGDCAADGREEYERLIRTTYKDFYAEDTQRLINKRFRKYKVLEEKVKLLESEAQKYADVERLISEERERAVCETEERMLRQFRAMRSRGEENAVVKKSQRRAPDVSALTKSERAHLASRALMGEKIKF